LFFNGKGANELLERITGILPWLNAIEGVTPKNLKPAKIGWIEGVTKNGVFGNPAFVYDELMLAKMCEYTDLLKTAYDELCMSDGVLPMLLSNRVSDAIRVTEMAQSIIQGNDRRTADINCQIYGRPNDKILNMAKEAISKENYFGVFPSRFTDEQINKLKRMSFNADQIKHWFQCAIDIIGVNSWNIVVSDNISAIDVRDRNTTGKPTVFVPTTRRVSGLKLLELIGHEINCHLRDSSNTNALLRELAEDSPWLLPYVSTISKADSEILYEAHAKMSDISINGTTSIPKPYYIVAQDRAAQGCTFSEVAEYIYNIQKETTKKSDKRLATSAWNITYRVFRGCTNTEGRKGYVFWKDHGYLSGYLMIPEIPTRYLDYATLTISEIKSIAKAGIDLSHPAYPEQDIVGSIAMELLT